jgi:molybdopterin converting factor small subunit
MASGPMATLCLGTVCGHAAGGAPALSWPTKMAPMNITLKLFATLTDYLPAEARRSNQVALDIDPALPISKIIEPFGLPPKLVHLVLVNGKYIEPEKRMTATLVEGDVLAIWPPIAGG